MKVTLKSFSLFVQQTDKKLLSIFFAITSLLSLSSLEVCIKKAEFSDCKGLKSEFKGQIVSKFDLGLLNAYNPIILIEISVKIRMAKISKGCLSEN